ncbi:MAG: hypothetical protein Unbinned4834contig1000_70 [Prokaryotic dsDNA virus sp.]|nr:MAG: hypothetical protein Unbinned4834contig1000_70 [Prokaryotic dsDNA virus sp.]
MAVSGSKDFELDVAEYIEEAFERCGIEAKTGYDLKSAKRSMNLLFADWANRGLNRWTIEQSTVSLVQGTASYSLGADTIDILSAVVRTNAGQTDQQDISIDRVSREEFLNIPTKNTQQRPTQFYVDRQINPNVRVWPTPDASYTLVYDRLVRIDDADTQQNTLDLPFRFYPCLAAGLAYYISMKRAPDRTQLLRVVYEEEFARAAKEDRDRASFKVVPNRNFYRAV